MFSIVSWKVRTSKIFFFFLTRSFNQIDPEGIAWNFSSLPSDPLPLENKIKESMIN